MQKQPILNRKIKIGIVGCGRISKNHFGSLEKLSDQFQLVGVCDTDPRALKEAAESSGVTGYPSLLEMLEKSDADAYALCTPSGLHARQAIMIAEKGKHVISEKPMATNWSDGKAMVEACDRNNVHLFVVKQNRHNATLQLVKRAVEQKRFGRIYMVSINVFWSRPQSYYDQAKWRGTWEFDGGALMNQSSHYVDLLDWLIGPIESIQAYTATLGRDIEVEDTAVAAIRWRSGALGSCNVTMLTHERNYEGSLTIFGEKGTVRIGGLAVNEVQTWEFKEPHPDDKLVKDASYQTTSVYGFGHPHYYENVAKTLRGEEEPYTDGRQGLKSLEVIVAAYLSARDGRKVALPLEY
jgi:UDP-N-acetyl-2-amino-2-deoxyglucuronate dehydrogenase